VILLSETAVPAFEVRKCVLGWFLSLPLPTTLETMSLFSNVRSVLLRHNTVLITQNNINYSRNVTRWYMTTFKLRKLDLNEHRLALFCTHLPLTPALGLVSPKRNAELQAPASQTLGRKWLRPKALGTFTFQQEPRALRAAGSDDAPTKPSRADPGAGATSSGEILSHRSRWQSSHQLQ